MSEHVYTYESPEYVQFFLDNLKPMESFVVIFHDKELSQRKYVGQLDPNGTTRKENVPFMTDEGWKSFNVNRVLYIKEA